jgi:iron complex outermembrane receptor protein
MVTLSYRSCTGGEAGESTFADCSFMFANTFRLTGARLAVLAVFLPAASAALAQSPANLKPIVVTGERIAGARESQPFGSSVISAEDIARIGAVTVNDAIMRLLGVVGRQDFYGGGDYSLDLRGFGTTSDSNQVVIVDGIRLSEADTGGTRLAGIAIDQVAQIEVIRGSGAVLYGEGATGGVIIITTKAGAGVERKNSASLYAGAGSFGLREGRANATIASGGFSLDIGAMDRKSDNFRDNFKSKSDALSVSGQWSNDWLRFGASRSEDNLSTGLPGALSAEQYASNPRQAQSAETDDQARIENIRNSVFAEASVGNWLLAFEAGQRKKNLSSQSVIYMSTSSADISANNYGLRAINTFSQALYSSKLVLGSDYSRWTRDSTGTYAVNTAMQAARAFYFREEMTLTSTGSVFSVGARTESINKLFNASLAGAAQAALADRQNAWELGLSQPLNEQLSVYGRVGESYRLANADEYSYVSPNTILLPQRSKDLEFGTRYKAGSFNLEARFYRSALTNEIGFDPIAARPDYATFGSGANVNFDPTRRSGIELDGSYALSKSLSLRGNAALRKSTFTAGQYAGKDVALAPRQSLALHADWIPTANHLLSGGVNAVSTQRPDFANQCSMPSYTTADARYAYSWSNMEVSVGLRNLFDRKYYTQAFGCTDGVTNGIYPESGRAATVALRVKF